MKVITTREIRQEAKTYLELAEIERVSIKRGKKFVNLIVSDTPDKVFVDESWIKELLSIPEEYRCNPFEVSPSGDLFWADKRNVEQLQQSVEVANTEKRTLLHKEDQKKFLGIE